MNTSGDESTSSATHGASPTTHSEDPKEQRRRELQTQECAKRGVRFLPAQVMRSVYEREGLL